MIHPAPTVRQETPENPVGNRLSLTGRRLAIVLILAKAVTGCSSTVGNPFGTVATYDAATNDLIDAVAQDAPPPPLDRPTADNPDNPQMDVPGEVPTSMDASVDVPTTDLPDGNSPESATDTPPDTTPDTPTIDDRPADVAPEAATMDGGVEDNGPDGSFGGPDTDTRDTAEPDRPDVSEDRADAGPDVEIMDEMATIDVADVTDSPDNPDTTDARSDTPTEVSTDAGRDAGVDAGTVTEITYTTSPFPSCTRIVVEGIPGCLPGATTCTYRLSSGGCVRYIAESVTIPTTGTPRYNFTQMLSGAPLQAFDAPNTGACQTPTVSPSTYTVRMTIVIGVITASCFGPTITVTL